jgi:hypothetical protein
MKTSARKMDSKTSTISSTAKDNGLTYSNGGQVGHISHNCPNRDLMKKLLKQALFNKDAPTPKSGHLHRNKKKGCVLTGRKERGWLAEEKEVKQEINSETESEFENPSESDSEMGKVKGGQQLQLYHP